MADLRDVDVVVDDAAIFAIRMGSLSLVAALTYTVCARLTPLDVLPAFLHARVSRIRSIGPYVAGLGLLTLLVGCLRLGS